MKTPPFKARECPKCHDPGPLDVVSGVCQRCHATAAHKAYQVDLEGRLGHLRPTDTSSLKDWETPSVCGKSVMGPDDMIRKCPLAHGHAGACDGRHPSSIGSGIFAVEAPARAARGGLRRETAVERFTSWYSSDGDQIYDSRQKAFETWVKRGIQGIPSAPASARQDLSAWLQGGPRPHTILRAANLCEPCRHEKHDKCAGVTKSRGVCKCPHAKRDR